MNNNLHKDTNANERPDRILTYLMCYFTFFYLLFSGPRMLQDPDLLWHIGLGKDILNTGQVPRFDTYSWTLAGLPYVSKDWMSEVLLAFTYNHAGFIGVFLLCSASVLLALAFLGAALSKKLPPPYTLIFCAASLLLLAPHLLSRPHILILPLLVVWSIGLLHSAERGSAPSLLLIPILFFWSQMHGSFILGIGLLPFFFFESLAQKKSFTLSEILPYVLFLFASLSIPFLGPYGFGILKGIYNQLILQETLYFIKEWHPQDFSHLSLFQVILLCAIGSALYAGFSLPLNRIILLMLLLHMALTHIRHVDFLALLTPLLIVTPVSRQISYYRQEPIVFIRNTQKFVVFSLVLAIVISGFVFKMMSFKPLSSVMLKEALQKLTAVSLSERGLNSYDFGGFLIFEGKKTYIDGRQDFYGPDFVKDYAHLINLTNASELEKILLSKDITWALLKTADPVSQAFDQLSDWKLIYSDAYAKAFVRLEPFKKGS